MFRRRTLWIETVDRLGIVTRSFSYSLLLKIGGLILSGGLLSGGILLLVVQHPMDGDYSTTLYALQQFKRVLLSRTLLIGLVVGLLITAAVALINLIYSHRIAGPLYRIEREAERVREGDLTVRIQLRQGDAVGPLADELSRLAEKQREQVEELRQRCERWTAEAEALAHGADAGEMAVAEQVTILRKSYDALRETLSGIRL